MTFEHIMKHQTGVTYQIMIFDEKPDNRFILTCNENI